MEKLVSRWAHNPKTTGSSPVLATNLRINYPKAGWFETSDRLWCNGAHWPWKVRLAKLEIRAGGLRFDSLLIYLKRSLTILKDKRIC
jgi:hypothetical protein